MRFRFSLIAFAFFFVFAFSEVCWTSSVSAGLISESQEIEIGRSVGKQLEKQYGLVPDQELQDRVQRIGMKLVNVSDRRNLPYSFKVLNSKEVNALAAPGGYIYLFKGLVDKMPSDDELAGVIGHEVGHVVKRHTVRQIEKSLGMSILFGVIFGDRGVLLQNLAYNAIMAGYSREDEREADYLGFVHSFKAGYNPYSMQLGLMKLSEMDQKYHYDLFSDHPESKSRVAAVKGFAQKNGVTPQVSAVEGGGYRLFDGTWQLPPLYANDGGYKAEYRAYFTAGILYRLSQASDYDAVNYIVDSDGTNATLYYQDTPVVTLTPQDASANQAESPVELAGTFVEKLQEWRKK